MTRNAYFILLILISAFSVIAATNTKSVIDDSGDLIHIFKFDARNHEPVPSMKPSVGTKAYFVLNNVPAYTYCYGQFPTITAILAGYYDNFGSANAYTGPAGGGLQPLTNEIWQTSTMPDTDQCPVAASKHGVDGRIVKGHGDDYWTGYLDENDPFYGYWIEHDTYSGQACTADFMGSNQWYSWNSADGETSLAISEEGVYDYTRSETAVIPMRDAVHGIKLFWESLGYTVDQNYSRYITGYNGFDEGFTFEMYKSLLDKGIPVILILDGCIVLGIGYDDSHDPPVVYIRDGWDNNTDPAAHSMEWGGSYANMKHIGVSVIKLSSESYFSAPDNISAINIDRTVVVSWDDPSKGTKTMSYQIFRDGVQIGTSDTESYSDGTAVDGIHEYKVKAVYLDEDPDLVSYFSDTSTTYVSLSAVQISDDFESGSSQWILNDGWGLDTEFAYQGTKSLSESPGGNYTNDTDQFPAGGSVAELAKALNFSSAADAVCSFWIRYAIEDYFDHLYFQCSTDGIYWETLRSWSSEDSENLTWHQENIRVNRFAASPNVRFRFNFSSDEVYNTIGVNIDDFSITPSETDISPPFVNYSKEPDFYTPTSEGFEVSAEITDYSGINYARIKFKVNGGSEQTLNPASVEGSVYNFIFPIQYSGSLFEFYFDCMDNSATQNQGYSEIFRFIEGIHQKFDSVSSGEYTEIVTTTNKNDIKFYAVKFSSYFEDICGSVIRTHFDPRLASENSQMKICVWANNAGMPGAQMITPLVVNNTASADDPDPWIYVNLSNYTALDCMVGDYFIGIECVSAQTGVTRAVSETASEDGIFNYGKSFKQYYSEDNTGLIWEQDSLNNYEIRCVTHYAYWDPVPNYWVQPPLLTVDISQDSIINKGFSVSNLGGYTMEYNAVIEYAGNAGPVTVHENMFESGLGWTASGSAVWMTGATLDGGSLNGTQFAYIEAAVSGAAATKYGLITSEIMDLSSYVEAKISFAQKKSTTNSTGLIEASTDGVNWNTLFTVTQAIGEWGTPDRMYIVIPVEYRTASTQFRFQAQLPKLSGYWAIDDIVITGYNGYNWLKLNGANETSGSVPVGDYEHVDVVINTSGMINGEYKATAKFSTAYDSQDVPVTISVLSGIAEIVPSETKLYQNYPNPFNPETTIKYSIERDSHIKLSVYNQAGQVVKVLAAGNKKAGAYSVKFNASGLSSGAYYYKLEADDKTISKKMLMVK